MTTSPEHPLQVAVVGSGPAGFYVIQSLLQAKDVHLRVDLFDRLPTPYGLVRYGVAPDHQKIKNVTAVYEKLGRRAELRFFGNVEYGTQLSLEDLRRCYHQVVFATGAQSDRRLGIPGEDLPGSHPATEFVAWYNGHPDCAHLEFDLGCERAVVIGVGNVAIDVARILCRTPEELATTDIADYALEALRASRVREVWLVGRRGPAQAAFTNAEVQELGEMEGAEARTLSEEVELDPLSAKALEAEGDRALRRKVEILQSYARATTPQKPRLLTLRFLLSPTEILASPAGRVGGLRLVRNTLEPDGRGGLRAQPTAVTEEVATGLVFRSVGYRGVALAGLPFLSDQGTIPHQAGRVLEAAGGVPLVGLYVAGWIKRGPTGVIGTNKPDAAETVASMLEDLARGALPAVQGKIEPLLAARGVRPVTFDEWLRLDALECERGRALGRPRLKLTDLRAMVEALDS